MHTALTNNREKIPTEILSRFWETAVFVNVF